MKKLIIVGLSAVLALMAIEPAHAQDQKVLAVIDTAIDSNRVPQVIYEACFTVSLSMACPNGQRFMEGKGSASSPLWPSDPRKPVYHGHNVVQSALKTNPDLKIVFIRTADITVPNPTRRIIGGDQAAFEVDSMVRALKWVSENAAKYSIDAVATSQSSIVSDSSLLRASSLTSYNASCVNQSALSSVSVLNSQNIPVFAATGNDESNTRVGFPACLNVDGVIGVGALIQNVNIIAKATNKGPGLDVVAQSSINVQRYDGTPVDFLGTSAATPIAAAIYVGSNRYTSVSLFINSLLKVQGYPNISK